MSPPTKILLLGSGELGKEFVIAAQKLGLWTIAVDRYSDAPAMQVADEFEVIDMLQAKELRRIVKKYKPTIIVPEIEAIHTPTLAEFEKNGIQVVPKAKAVHLTMNRDAIRDFAHDQLQLKTARYAYASNFLELEKAAFEIGFPCVIKPVMSSSGKGQSICHSSKELLKCWKFALSGMRGKIQKIIIEEFIHFESEITLLTIKQKNGKTIFVDPIGHLQERGDYQESWLPARISKSQLMKAQKMAKKMTDHLGGAGLFGVEFFLTKDEVLFSELSPRPHDTGLVTLISQDLSEFELHLRAILNLPIPKIKYLGPSASAVILGKKESSPVLFKGLAQALSAPETELRLFGKPLEKKHRRMGVALARGKTIEDARRKARRAAQSIKII